MTDLPRDETGQFTVAAPAEQYPEHAKLTALNGDNDKLGQFIEWLGDKGYTICKYEEGKGVYEDEAPGEFDWEPSGYYPVPRRVEQWLADYFGINLNTLDDEKRAMLDSIRAAYAAAEAKA